MIKYKNIYTDFVITSNELLDVDEELKKDFRPFEDRSDINPEKVYSGIGKVFYKLDSKTGKLIVADHA